MSNYDHKRILVVEDDRITSMDIQNSVKTLGFTLVDAVTSGEVAVSRAAEADLVLMDIHLEGAMDGIEAAAIIRERHDVPVVFLTVLSDIKTLERAIESEPFAFIVKPFEPGELRSAIHIALSKNALERSLRSTQARFDVLAGSNLGCIFTITDGRFSYVNPLCATLLERTPEGLGGAAVQEIFGPEQGERILGATVQATPANPLRLEACIDVFNKEIWLDLAIAPSPASGEDIICVGMDITERKKRDKLLELGRLALNAATDPVILYDAQGHILFANEAAASMLGYSAETLLTRTIPDIDEDFDSQRWQQHWATRTPGEVTTIQTRHRTQDGSVIPVEVIGHAISLDGDLYGCSFLRAL